MIKKVLIAGGSGLIGQRLTTLLQQNGFEVSWLSRRKKSITGVRIYLWNTELMEIDSNAVQWADAIINLSGEGIAEKRWTAARKNLITGSRVKGIELIANSLANNTHNVQCIIASAAVGYYGDNGDKWLTEESAAGKGFLSSSSAEWENASVKLIETGIRLVIMRTGIVLSLQGGALPELKKTLAFGIAPILGNGRQYYSWIHIDDVCGFILYAVNQQNVVGTYNLCANSITQKGLMQAIQKVFGKFSILAPAPAFLLRILLGEMADTVLVSQRIQNKKILDTGFQLQFTNPIDALTDLRKNRV